MITHPSIAQLTQAMTHRGFAPCNEDKRYEVPGDSGICTEIETLTMLFGLVRMLRPEVVVETGCNMGCASKVIVEALRANGAGVLHSCDTEVAFVEAAYARLDRPIDCFLFTHESGIDLVRRDSNADLYFLDSSEQSRMEELEHLKVHGKRGAIVTVHDTSLYPQVRQAVESFSQHVILPGPRGLGIITL